MAPSWILCQPPYAICEAPPTTGPNPTFNMEMFGPSPINCHVVTLWGNFLQPLNKCLHFLVLILITTSNIDSGQCYVLSATVVKYRCLTVFYASPPYAICETPPATGPNPTFKVLSIHHTLPVCHLILGKLSTAP